MPRYLISFDDGSMDHIREEDWPTVGEASRAVVREIKQAGGWIFGGGVLRQQASIVSTDGSVADGPLPETKAAVGGFSIIEVASREEALAWAARSPSPADVPKRYARSCTTRSPEARTGAARPATAPPGSRSDASGGRASARGPRRVNDHPAPWSRATHVAGRGQGTVRRMTQFPVPLLRTNVKPARSKRVRVPL